MKTRCSVMSIRYLLGVIFAAFVALLLAAASVQTQTNSGIVKSRFASKFAGIAEAGNYTCDELVRWLGTEKHYSNDKKDVLFKLIVDKNCNRAPVVMLDKVSFGLSAIGIQRTFSRSGNTKTSCARQDEYAVVFLSNFSINNNFSHFLHGLLRLFCALLDARWLVWNAQSESFVPAVNYTIWLDEYLKISDSKMVWLKSLGAKMIHLNTDVAAKKSCVTAQHLLYGSGCVKLLPPEKWFGYPGCRASDILPAFGYHLRKHFKAPSEDSLYVVDGHVGGLRVAFAVRDASALTGKREISNLAAVQSLLKETQHVKTSTENVTFEHLDIPSTVRYMAGVHIFISVNGAGMTNMFFMNPGSAVVEIIPHPLCNCRSPDYFYGEGGYYHGSAVAQKIKHYTYCVPPEDTKWHEKPKDLRNGGKCSWRHLHAVESVYVEPSRFVSIMRKVERDLVIDGTIVLTAPIINMGPHANG
jgi:hypothetical protein